MIRCRNCCVRSSRGALKICAGGPFLEDRSRVEEADPVRDVAREAHLVRRDHHRHAARGELADHVEHLGHELRVERARDLVEQEQLGLHRERAHDRDALLLPAREPVRVLVALVGEAEALEERGRLRLGLARATAPSAFRGASVTFSSTDMCGKRLNDWKTIPIRRPHPVDVDVPRRDLDAADDDPAGVDRLEQVDAAQQGRLPRAGSADQADDLVLGDARGRSRAALRACRRTCAGPRARGSGRARGSREPPGLMPPPVPRDQPVREARERDRDQHEQRRRDEVRRAVERRRLVDLGLPERLDDAERADERGVLLEPDEVVQERRDDAAHGLRERRRTAGPGRARARASALPRPGSGARSRCPSGRPRRRTPCRRARARRRPRRTASSASRRARAPASRSRGSRSRGSSGCRGRGRRRRSRARGAGRRPAGQRAEHRDEERGGEDEDLRDAEELHVQPEGVEDLREAVLVDAPVEEVRLERAPAGRARDDDDDDGDEDRRGDEGDGDRPRLLRDVDGRAAEDPRVAALAQWTTSGLARRSPSRARCAGGS